MDDLNKFAWISTVADLSCEVLNMAPIGMISFGCDKKGYDGGAAIYEDSIEIDSDSLTGKGYPDQITHICHVVAHEVKHAFQRRAVLEPDLIFEENKEIKDKERIREVEGWIADYRELEGAEYELQPIELDAACFAGLVVACMTESKPQPVEYAKELYKKGFRENLKYYGDVFKEVFTPEHIAEVFKENLEVWKEDLAS